MQVFKSIYHTVTSNAGGGRKHIINNRTIREEKLLSEGAFAYVWLCRDVHTNEEFALKKMLCQDKERYALARHEITIYEKLSSHPNIVQYYGSTVNELGKAREVLILMEYCGSGHLLTLLDRHNGYLSESTIVAILRDICNGVFELHRMSPLPLAHRDIKVENVLGGQDGLYKLCDFGSSSDQIIDTGQCSRDETLQLEEVIQKNTTMMYRPPEMVDVYKHFEVSEKVDIWMIGCVLFTLAFYRHPFQDESCLAIANAKFNIPSKDNRYSGKISSLIHWMLSINPKERPSAEELLEILSRYTTLSSIPLPKEVAERQKAYEEKQAVYEAELKIPLADVVISSKSASKRREVNSRTEHRHLRNTKTASNTTATTSVIRKRSKSKKSKRKSNNDAGLSDTCTQPEPTSCLDCFEECFEASMRSGVDSGEPFFSGEKDLFSSTTTVSKTEINSSSISSGNSSGCTFVASDGNNEWWASFEQRDSSSCNSSSSSGSNTSSSVSTCSSSSSYSGSGVHGIFNCENDAFESISDNCQLDATLDDMLSASPSPVNPFTEPATGATLSGTTTTTGISSPSFNGKNSRTSSSNRGDSGKDSNSKIRDSSSSKTSSYSSSSCENNNHSNSNKSKVITKKDKRNDDVSHFFDNFLL